MSKRVSKVSIDHDEIRRWAEARGGEPAVVRGSRGPGPGILRLDFPGYSGQDKLERVSWDQWFEKFDASNLALVFQEKTARGQKSNFNKLVGRETVDIDTGAQVRPPRRRAKQAAARTEANGRRTRSARTGSRRASTTPATKSRTLRASAASRKRAAASKRRRPSAGRKRAAAARS